jgi:hypothetical protein
VDYVASDGTMIVKVVDVAYFEGSISAFALKD